MRSITAERMRGLQRFVSTLGGWDGKERVLEREQFFPLPPERVFAPFADAANLQAITPPWLHFKIISELPINMDERAVIEYRLRLHGLPVRWRTVIETWEPPHRFTDIQERGPFALWHHTHTFEPVDGGTSTLARDRVRYRVGFGPLGEIAHALLVGRDLGRIFDFRRTAVLNLVTNNRENERYGSNGRALAVADHRSSGPDGRQRAKVIVLMVTLLALITGASSVLRRTREHWR